MPSLIALATAHRTVRMAAERADGSTETIRRWARCHVIDCRRNEMGNWMFAGDDIDAAPNDRERAYHNAGCLRSAIADLVDMTVLEATKLAGPRGLAFDPAFSQRTQELMLYVRQHHGALDLADLGRHVHC